MEQFAKWAPRIFFAIAMPLFLITFSCTILFNLQPLYTWAFDRYDVSASTNLSKEQLADVARETRAYFNSSEEYLEITVTNMDGHTFELFDQEEKEHMQDVRGLVHVCYAGALILGAAIIAILVFGFWKKKEQANMWLAFGGGGAFVMIAMFAIAAMVNFDGLFNFLHSLFFEDGTWFFDPNSQYLTKLYPREFWVAMGYVVGIFTTVAALIMFVVGLWRSGYTYRIVRPQKNQSGQE